MIVLLLIALQVVAPPSSTPPSTPATEPAFDPKDPLNLAAHAAGSPERAYLDLVIDVRAGRLDSAFERLQAPPGRFLEMVFHSLHMYYGLEWLKDKISRRFGAASVDHLDMGFYPDRMLRTLRASVKGDVATLSFIAPGTGRRRDSTIVLQSFEGVWKPNWHGYATGVDASLQDLTDEDIEQFIKTGERMKQAVEEVAKRLDAGEFKSSQEVKAAVVEEVVKAAKKQP